MSIEHPLTTPLIQENPLALRVLGLCPALAITNSLTSALIMSAALTVVLVISNTIISLVRKLLPSSVRLIVQITIIASAVTVIVILSVSNTSSGSSRATTSPSARDHSARMPSVIDSRYFTRPSRT